VKIVTVFPDNGRRSLPSIYGQYLLLDGETGASLALLDGSPSAEPPAPRRSPRATCRGSIQRGC